MFNSLPESLIIEILSWLPVKSLLQFKYVCKSWYKIIKSPYFIYMHLMHNYGPRRTDCFIAQYAVTQAGELEPFLLWHGESDEGNTIHNSSSLDCDRYSNHDICGPCYGIYYLGHRWPDGYTFITDPRCLWNPALNEIKKLPPMIMNPNISSNMEYYDEYCGFGFDPVTLDYKVVAIKGYVTNDEDGSEIFLDYPLSILIYSLRADSWKYSGDLSKRYYIPDANSCHAFVNRSFYWLGSDEFGAEKHDVIIAIDLATEECQEIGLPDICIKGSMTYGSYSECLMVYNGSIALVALYKEERNFDIWTLKGTTWCKELTMELDRRVYRAVGHYSVDNNLVLFVSRNCLILCDPNTKETLKLKARVSGTCKTVSAYMESLVPLNDRNFWDQIVESKISASIP